MKICIVGAGAMGSSYGVLLQKTGHGITMVDIWPEHVAAVKANGLKLDGAAGEHLIKVPIATTLPANLNADLAMVWTDSNNTRAAAATAKAALAPSGFAITLQNGIGNVETLADVIGRERTVAGSSMCSAAMRGPGHASLTHKGPTSIGEIGGGGSARIESLKEILTAAGFEVKVAPDIMSVVWTKFTLNCAINAICATTGLRLGEVARVPAVDKFQDYVIDEILAVTKAKGITLTDPDFRATVKTHCWNKFSRPSMLQHIHAGKKTEIDALNMKLVEEGRKLGIPTPYNESLALLLKGVEFKAGPGKGRTEADYAAFEEKAKTERRSGSNA